MRRRLARIAATRAGNVATGLAVGVLDRIATRPAGMFSVLTYHRVDETAARPDLHPGLLSATPGEFDAQIRELAAVARPISLTDLLAARAGRPLPPRAVLVTFDDGYADVATHAWPILRRHGVPAVLFVATAYPGTGRPFWWDRLHHAISATSALRLVAPWGEQDLSTPTRRPAAFRDLRRRLKDLDHEEAMGLVEAWCAELGVPDPAPHALDWATLRLLAGEGLAIAPHTRTHSLLTRVSAGQVEIEVAGSLADLREFLGEVPPVLAYPSGAHDAAAREIVRRLGFAIAFTTDPGTNDARRIDWLAVRRFNVGLGTSPAILRLATHPWVARVLTGRDR